MNSSNRGGQAEHWQQRLEQYLKHLTALNRSPGTISDHKTVVGRWIQYAISHNQDPGVFDEAAIEGYLDPLNLAANSKQSYVSHIRGWCKYWDGRTTGFPRKADTRSQQERPQSGVAVDADRPRRSTDTRSLQERLESAAEKLLCEVSYLREIVGLLEDKGQVILYGPPGTGKTYLAQELAEALAPDEHARSLVQFHPAYSRADYEDFFEGYRPVADDDKQMTYKLTPGPLAEDWPNMRRSTRNSRM